MSIVMSRGVLAYVSSVDSAGIFSYGFSPAKTVATVLSVGQDISEAESLGNKNPPVSCLHKSLQIHTIFCAI